MKIYFSYNVKLKTDLNRVSSKNVFKDKLIKLIYKFVKLIIEINNKVRKPKIYNKAINKPINENKQYKIIDK